MHQSALPSNVMPLLCGIMLLFTLLRLPIYLSYLVPCFIFFSIHPFLQRDPSRSTAFLRRKLYLSHENYSLCIYSWNFRDLYWISFYFSIQKRRYSRDGLLAFRSNTPPCVAVYRSAFLSNGIKMKYKRSL